MSQKTHNVAMLTKNMVVESVSNSNSIELKDVRMDQQPQYLCLQQYYAWSWYDIFTIMQQ